MAGDTSSDDDVLTPSRVRPTIKKDASPAGKVSPIVTAAARRQLRGGTPEQKSAAEIAAEYRRKMKEPMSMPATATSSIIGQASPQTAPHLTAQSPSTYTPASTPAPNGMAPIAKPSHDQASPPSGADADSRRSPSMYTPQPTPATSWTRSPGASDVLQAAGGDGSEGRSVARMVTIGRRTTVGMGVGAEGNVGIGIKFVPNEEGEMVVTSLLDGAPADQSKEVFAGDVIVAVGGTHVHGRTSEDVKKLIVGKPGTAVELLLRQGKPEAVPSSFSATKPPPPVDPTSDPRIPGGGPSDNPKPAPSEPKASLSDSKASHSVPKEPLSESAHSTPPPAQPQPQAQPQPSLVPRTEAAPARNPQPSVYLNPAPSVSHDSTVTSGSVPWSSSGRATDGAVALPAGIGIKFGIDRFDRIAVIGVLASSPVGTSGKILPRNRLLAVDGVPLTGKSAPEVESLIAGPEGSEVSIRVLPSMDASESQAVDVSLVRQSKARTQSSRDALSDSDAKPAAPGPVPQSSSFKEQQAREAAKERGPKKSDGGNGLAGAVAQGVAVSSRVQEEKMANLETKLMGRLEALEVAHKSQSQHMAEQNRRMEDVDRRLKEEIEKNNNKCCVVS